MSEKKARAVRREVNNDLKDLSILKFTKTERFDWTLKGVNKGWKDGFIITIEEWLQRCAQEKAWTASGYNKSINYFQGLIQEENTISQSMTFIEGEKIKVLLENQLKISTNQAVKKIAKQMLTKLNDAAAKVGGIKLIKICIDGQNRGRYAIRNYFENKYPIEISFQESTECNGSYYYDELPQSVQNQIDNILVQCDVVHTIDIQKVLEKVIAMNEGVSWGNTERRSIKFTDVSWFINKLSSDPIVSWFFKKVLVENKEHGIKGVGGEYYRHKKGDLLILSELLHYSVNGSFGSSKALDNLYVNQDIEDEIVNSFEDKIKFIADTFHKNQHLLNDIKVFSLIKDLYICLDILVNKNGGYKGAMFGAQEVIKLSDIKDSGEFIKSLLKPMNLKYDDKSDREASRTINSVTKQPTVRYIPKPNTWAYHHKSQQLMDIKAREEFLVTKEPKILKTAYQKMCANNIVAKSYQRTDIDESVRRQLELENTKTDYQRWDDFKPAHVKTLDHTKPVVDGGSNDISNLGLMSKELNSSKNAR